MLNRKAFTLIEVLISIALMGLILVPLFSVVEMMRNSNDQLLHSLEKSTQITKATKVLFLDIMSSDGNFTIKKDEMTRFCMEETSNSLYGLSSAKVCWLVLKEKNTLVRAEGNAFKLPLGYEDKVEVDKIIPFIEIFDISRDKDKVLVVIKQKEKEPISFLVQGIYKPKPKITGLENFPAGTKKLPDGTIVTPDGKKYLPGTTMDKNGIPRPPKRTKNKNKKPKTGGNTGNNRRGDIGNSTGGKPPENNLRER